MGKILNQKQNTLNLLAFSVIVFTLGVNFIFVKLENEELSPFWGAFLRYITASILLTLFAFSKKIRWPRGKALIYAFFYGLLTFGANSSLLYWGLKWVPVSVASVIYATVPLSTLIIASFFKLEKITFKNLLGSILVIPGISMIFQGQINYSVNILPFTAIILASVCVALASNLIKKAPICSPVTTNAISMLSGSGVLFALSLSTRETLALPVRFITWLSISWLILSSTTAFILLIWMIRRWNASKVSYNSVLSPIITIAVGILVFKQTLSNQIFIGGILVLLGILTQIKSNIAEEII